MGMPKTFQVRILTNYLTSLGINFVICKTETNIPVKMHNLIVKMTKYQKNQTEATFYKRQIWSFQKCQCHKDKERLFPLHVTP